MEQTINITKSIGEYAYEDYDTRTGCFNGKKVLPCTEYTTKEQGDKPLYQAMLMAAHEVLPYMVSLHGGIKEGEFTISELAKVKCPPLHVDRNLLPTRLRHLRFLIGGSKYEAAGDRIFCVLDGVRKIARAGTKDKLRWGRTKGETNDNHEPLTLNPEPESLPSDINPQPPSFADRLRAALRARLAA